MRARYFRIAVVLLFLPILVRVVKYQVLEHPRLYQESLRNYIKSLKLEPVRGEILDRHGIPIASYKPQFKVSIIPAKMTDEEWALLSQGLHLQTPRDSFAGAAFVTLKSGLSIEQVTFLEERTDRLPWVFVSPTTIRYYPFGGPFFHGIGYIGRVTAADLRRGYDVDDYRGKSGLERVFEDVLRGQKGARFLATDAHGRITKLDPIPPIPPKSGQDLHTTLDIALQLYADTLFQPYTAGAVVMMDLRDGGLLVLYSKPYVDPNRMVRGLTAEEWRALVRDSTHPLLNRAVSGRYPPGSTLKPLIGAIALDLGLISPTEKLAPCTGRFAYGDRIWRCWYIYGHGRLNLYQAIQHSCDVYFYQVGLRIGLRRLLRILNRLPLTDAWLPLNEMRSGFIPTLNWYRRTYGRYGFSEGAVLNLAIGQGEILLTPLDLTVMTALLAKGPEPVPAPHLIQERETAWLTLPFANWVFPVIRKAMRRVVEKGTGQAAKVQGIPVAGKTGTAQNPHGEDHSLFIAFAPADDPEVAITVVVENAGHGGEIAAPIAGKLLQRYFQLEGRIP